MNDRLRRRLMPGSVLLEDPKGWAPAVPADIAEPPPVSVDGSAACSTCNRHLPLDRLSITAHGYRCDACATREALGSEPAVDVETVKIGRGRWWIMPIVVVIGSAITIAYPAAVFVAVGLVAATGFVLFLRRGL